MGILDKKIGPVFLKEESDASLFVEKMEGLREQASGDLVDLINQEIMFAKYGIVGEKSIAFELKNSGMDMYILHDLYLKDEDLSAQIDYLVITRKRIYIVECKNLIGNIEIDNAGTFIRLYEWNGKKKKEAIYSPITQNERHRRVIKAVRSKTKNMLFRHFFEKDFDTYYQGIVVLANPKTCLNAKYAKKEVKDQVIRADQLIEYIKRSDAVIKDSMSNDTMYSLAKFFLDNHMDKCSDYAKKYEDAVQQLSKEKDMITESVKEEIEANTEGSLREERDNTNCVNRLKEFRLQQSRAEKIKPYYIFNDAQMQELIEKFPNTREELKNVSGFGEKKTEKYGEQILAILNEELR